MLAAGGFSSCYKHGEYVMQFSLGNKDIQVGKANQIIAVFFTVAGSLNTGGGWNGFYLPY